VPGTGWERYPDRSPQAFSRSDQIASAHVDNAEVRWFARSVTDRTSDIVGAVDDAPPASAAIDDEFLADVCHRVRTPLNGILGSLELLLGEEISDEARELAAAAFESARDLHRVFESEIEAVVAPADHLLRSLPLAPVDLAARAAR
jgi:signal transduction histidine kinase